MKRFIIAMLVLISTNSFSQELTAPYKVINQDSLIVEIKKIQYTLDSLNPKPTAIQVGATDNYYIEIEGNQRVATEILYTVVRDRDSTQTQFMINTDGSLTYRKFDCEIKLWSEWVKLLLTPANITDNGYLIILNGNKYYIRRR